MDVSIREEEARPLESNFVDEYIKSKRLAWARSSQRNERSRLNKHAASVLHEPKMVYEKLKQGGMCDHSIKTTFVRLGQFFQWMVDNDKIQPAKNPWKLFMKSHALIFKHAYQLERLNVTFEEAKGRIENEMVDPYYQQAARQLLEGGLRYCELRTFDGQAVIGKGSKPRAVFLREGLRDFRYRGSYSALYTRLKAVGLKPHTLRKLCATQFSNQPGVTDIDTCEVFGWESIETSKKYRQPKRREHLAGLLQGAVSR